MDNFESSEKASLSVAGVALCHEIQTGRGPNCAGPARNHCHDFQETQIFQQLPIIIHGSLNRFLNCLNFQN